MKIIYAQSNGVLAVMHPSSKFLASLSGTEEEKMIHLNWSYQGGVGRSSNSVVGEREMLPKDIQSIANFAGLGDKQSNK